MTRKNGFKIPGVSFSAKRALGISQAQAKLSRKLGVPLSKSGRQRKLGAATGCAVMLVPLFIVLFAGFLIVNSVFAKDTPQVISNINNNEATNEVSGKKSNIPEVSKSATEIKVDINTDELSQKIADAIKQNEDKKPWWNSTVIGAIISSIAVIATSVISYFFQKHNLKKQIAADLKKVELQITATDKHFERTTDIEIKKITEESKRQSIKLIAEIISRERLRWLENLKKQFAEFSDQTRCGIIKIAEIYKLQKKENKTITETRKLNELQKEKIEISNKISRLYRLIRVEINNNNPVHSRFFKEINKIKTFWEVNCRKTDEKLNMSSYIRIRDQSDIEFQKLSQEVWNKIKRLH